MSSQSVTNLERLETEVLTGQSRRSPRNIQQAFEEAAQQDVSNAITEEYQIQEPTGDNLWVVHYTDISAVISMLKNAKSNGRSDTANEPRSDYLRMYSTVGCNDPGEGKYLNRFRPDASLGIDDFNNIIWPEQQKTRQYAYVASFIQPNDQQRIHEAADNLVFWRSYGREGMGC